MPRALITGISGQDGSYLAELLLDEGYEVWGIVRRHSRAEGQTARIDHILDRLVLRYGDVTDPVSLRSIVEECRPDRVYNLAAQSHVRRSFDMPFLTAQINAVGVLHLLDTVRTVCPEARFYQASSSEMFGTAIDADGYQRETTPMHPTSPYGCAKLYAYSLVRHYRRAYGMFACNGILFNHSSRRRGINFVLPKFVIGALKVKHGDATCIEVGDLSPHRDFGHAAEYVRAIHAITSHSEPDDFVIATGQSVQIGDMLRQVCERCCIDAEHSVRQSARHLRSQELPELRGDAAKALSVLGWAPRLGATEILDELIMHWETELYGKS